MGKVTHYLNPHYLRYNLESILYVPVQKCIPKNMETYILKNSYYVALFCIHVCFQVKGVDASKGEVQVFFMTEQGQH